MQTMAPFSVCSKCQAITRKVVKDPMTRKDIYICPKCNKAMKVENNNLENEQDNITELVVPKIRLKETVEEPRSMAPRKLPLTAAVAGPSNILSPKTTPPMMETLVINGRKCVAISATASDNELMYAKQRKQ